MNLHSLTKIKGKAKRRLGQGHGSGRVKTSGRGTKGQNARSKRSLSFEGGALPLIKRLPFRRGKDRNHSYKNTPVIVNIKALELLKAGTVVDIKALVSAKIVSEKDAMQYGVKILGDGKLTKSYTIKLPISKKAADKIKKAGGSVE
ncbi:MAG: 50S ribosomal protein L15 [Candidatus Levybacteria bacterium GW2011_GWB1_35_5]|nr:MAG: 50S ribosomal protein L15 [Candidatus Levybacteria bacterium GW2011_GWB1_35_5]